MAKVDLDLADESLDRLVNSLEPGPGIWQT